MRIAVVLLVLLALSVPTSTLAAGTVGPTNAALELRLRNAEYRVALLQQRVSTLEYRLSSLCRALSAQRAGDYLSC